MHLEDLTRIFVGEVPGSFYIELIIRSIVIFLLLILSMRFMGKRMSGLLGRNELVAMVSLAAAVGIPLMSPDRGILAALIIAFVVIYIQRWVSARAAKSQKFEKDVFGNLDLLVKDSVIDLETMKKVRVTRERLVGQLRASGIKQLGTVKRFYIEASGFFTLIENDKPTPGLSVLPRWDKEFNERFHPSEDTMVCETCGTTKKKPFPPNTKCPHCKNVKWTVAVE